MNGEDIKKKVANDVEIGNIKRPPKIRKNTAKKFAEEIVDKTLEEVKREKEKFYIKNLNKIYKEELEAETRRILPILDYIEILKEEISKEKVVRYCIVTGGMSERELGHFKEYDEFLRDYKKKMIINEEFNKDEYIKLEKEIKDLFRETQRGETYSDVDFILVVDNKINNENTEVFVNDIRKSLKNREERAGLLKENEESKYHIIEKQGVGVFTEDEFQKKIESFLDPLELLSYDTDIRCYSQSEKDTVLVRLKPGIPIEVESAKTFRDDKPSFIIKFTPVIPDDNTYITRVFKNKGIIVYKKNAEGTIEDKLERYRNLKKMPRSLPSFIEETLIPYGEKIKGFEFKDSEVNSQAEKLLEKCQKYIE